MSQNEYDLSEYVIAFKESEDKNEIFELIFLKIQPLLRKYAYKLGDKDYIYYLGEALYNALLKIPTFEKDSLIVGYIDKTIFHEYIKLSKEMSKFSKELCIIDSENSIEITDKKDCFSNLLYDDLIIEIKSILNKEEFKIFELHFIEDMTETEISKIYSISRQAINKRTHKIKNIIKTKLII